VHDLLVAQAQILELASDLLEETNRQLTELTVLDPLTGCGNRRMLDQVLTRDWAYAQRDGKWISLILGDIDHFKLFNDEYGHVAGDDCLRAVANLLRSNCRRVTDTVVRFGGEEFLLVLPATKPENAAHTAASIREALAAAAIEHRASPLGRHLSMSFGVVSTRPAPDGTPDQPVAAAETVPSQGAREGRDRFVSVVVDASQPPPS
jgi:diguanylate cyclase (GGDEF)-like protein